MKGGYKILWTEHALSGLEKTIKDSPSTYFLQTNFQPGTCIQL